MTVDEIESYASTYTLKRITNAATYPALYSIGIAFESFENDLFDNYVYYLYETCEDEAAVQYTMHGLCIAQNHTPRSLPLDNACLCAKINFRNNSSQ